MENGVIIQDVYNNGIAFDDVTAGEASAGDITDYTVILKNGGSKAITQLAAWVDAAISFIEISHDDITYVSPKGSRGNQPAGALDLDNIAPGSSLTFYMRRTIPASSIFNPKVLTIVHWGFNGTP